MQDLIDSRAYETGVIAPNVMKCAIYSQATIKKINKLEEIHNKQITQLNTICAEVRDLCLLCDTYEEMRKVLADYEIIPNTKKRGK